MNGTWELDENFLSRAGGAHVRKPSSYSYEVPMQSRHHMKHEKPTDFKVDDGDSIHRRPNTKGERVMKRRFVALLAVGLIALGAIGDRVLSLSTGQSPAVVAKTTAASHAANTAPASNTTLSNHTAATTAATTANATSTSLDQLTEHAYAAASPSVVYIESVGTGTGSGVIYDTNGDIVTNAHVVDGASTLNVTLSDGRKFAAQLVGMDRADDLAVIRIHASGLKPATFARANSYQIAQTVLAIGSPLGLKQSVTSGLISGLGRVEQEPNGSYLPDSIQTSAPINPGNSGGALVTLNGVVVGMPTLEQTSSQGGQAAQNVGFAIPSARITALASQIISTGKVQHTGRAYLGISPTDPSAGYTSPFGGFGSPGGSTQNTPGAVVQQVTASGPAGKAGVQQGDTITAVNGTSISDAQGLLTILAQKKPGDTVSLRIDRGGSTLTIQVRLGELPG
jgi:S1-C subfamily serine protease